MKKRNPLQFELPGLASAFNLAGQCTADGERQAQEKAQGEADRAEAAKKQQTLPTGKAARKASVLKDEPRQYKVPEVKLMRLREVCGSAPFLMDNPQAIVEFWRENVPNATWFDPDKECLVVFMLNTRRRLLGFTLVATGTLDTLLVHAREVFKAAIVQGAAAIVIAHNHPSGDPGPSEADIKVTRDLIRAGQLLKIDVLDHVIVGEKLDTHPTGYSSLRELGYFYS